MLDIRALYRATNPSRTLDVSQASDRELYIDFSGVRGGSTIAEMRDKISFFSPDEPTVQLFTGHLGCGKSTELLRLANELREQQFHVIYFESSQDLEMGDIDVTDILLAIARRISESLGELEQLELDAPQGLQRLLRGAARILQTEIDLAAELDVPGLGTVQASTEGKGSFSADLGIPGLGQVEADSEGLSLVALGIGKISAKARNSPELRGKLREYLEVRTTNIIEAINSELIKPAIAKLKTLGKQGLVVIVDNLDRVEKTIKPWGRTQPEYLFVDRGEQLRQLQCHVIYTMPLALLYSNDLNPLTSRFGTDPKLLPMVPVRHRDGTDHLEGMEKMRQMILTRAFPNQQASERHTGILDLFESLDLFNDLCRLSGGHVREILRFLNTWIMKERQLPLSRHGLEVVIRERRDRMLYAITEDEWALLRQVHERKQVAGDDSYDLLISSMFVYEYRDEVGSWFDLNPILESIARQNS
jgi:hypothetical protein